MKQLNDKKKGFKLFDSQRIGKGISKNESLRESGLKRFFITYKNNFGKLISVNMFMVLGNFPLFFLVAVFSGYTKAAGYLPMNDIYQNLGGLFLIEDVSPFAMSLYGIEGLQTNALMNTTLTYIFYAISALTLFTFGIVNAGTAYILRNIAMGEPVFVWSDFWYAARRNWKAALPFGIIDGLINCILIFNVYTTVTSTGNFVGSMMFWGNIILMVLYFFMRCYIYVQMVTFDLKVIKIVKNSLIFTLVGLKRNALALLGNLLFIIIEILFLFGSGGILVPFAVAAPLAIMFSSMAYMKVFASYFKIKEVMIDPYKAEHPELFENENDADEEIIMRDDVTEKERLEAIKAKNNIN